MADGILCKHCGWQETEHELVEETEIKNSNKRIRGYKRTLENCRGFVGESEPEEISDEQMRYMEHQARGRFAWGQFSAQVRQENFNQELAQYDKIVERSYGEAKQNAVEKRKQFIKNAESQNHGFWVG